MRAAVVLRSLTPVGWGVLALATVAALTLVGGAVGLRWDPFGLTEKRMAAARAEAVAARSDAAARSLEVEGEVAQARRLEEINRQGAAVATATAAAVTQARRADDADQMLDPARAERLRAHDRELCRLAPRLDGCAPTPDPD